MFKTIYLDNFKSLVNFKLDLAKFVCLIGLNGTGKTTILQALDFLAQLTVGKLDEWLIQRRWNKSELGAKFSKKQKIVFTVVLSLPSDTTLTWTGEFNRTKLYCSTEEISNGEEILLKVTDGYYTLQGEATKIDFAYQGSILSQLRESVLSEELTMFKQELQGLKSLELLSPQLLKQRSRCTRQEMATAKLGLGGERLASFLDSLSKDNSRRLQLTQELKNFYPNFSDFQIHTRREGWQELSVKEVFHPTTSPTRHLPIESRHLSDGLLRIMAILAQTLTPHSWLLIDEIENGINPEWIPKLVQTLLQAPQQVLVTTHSPMILNYLTDEQAKEAILLVYKTPTGLTQIKRFFEIPWLREKLTVMGPGEAFVDTDLEAVVKQLGNESSEETGV